MLPFFRKLEACLIGMEACGTSHYWARKLSGLGHRAKLMPPAYVKPYVKRGKTDAGDAEAIAEAVTRPTMRFVAIKSPGQQSILARRRTFPLWRIRLLSPWPVRSVIWRPGSGSSKQNPGNPRAAMTWCGVCKPFSGSGPSPPRPWRPRAPVQTGPPGWG